MRVILCKLRWFEMVVVLLVWGFGLYQTWDLGVEKGGYWAGVLYIIMGYGG